MPTPTFHRVIPAAAFDGVAARAAEKVIGGGAADDEIISAAGNDVFDVGMKVDEAVVCINVVVQPYLQSTLIPEIGQIGYINCVDASTTVHVVRAIQDHLIVANAGVYFY